MVTVKLTGTVNTVVRLMNGFLKQYTVYIFPLKDSQELLVSSSQTEMGVEYHLHGDGSEIFAALLLRLHGNYQLAAAGLSEQ